MEDLFKVESSESRDLDLVPDYMSAIHRSLLRIERLLVEMAAHPKAGTSQVRPTMPISEAARYLGIGRSKLFELVRTNEIPSMRIGRRLLIPTRELDSYIQAHSFPLAHELTSRFARQRSRSRS
jgi:excisionase family DNA binding protein